MPKHGYEQYFPFKNIREQQATAIEFVLNEFESGKRFVIMDLPTGIGKSAIAIAIARYMNDHPMQPVDNTIRRTGAYILTTQKLLQEQYMKDFGPTSSINLLKSIKSSSNYQCLHYVDQTCAESRRILSKLGKTPQGTEFHKKCRGQCPYMLDKLAFIESPIGITNFPYFLAETMYAGKLEPRDLLVVDEAHVCESQLSSFIEVTFSEKFAKTLLKCRLPKVETQESVIEWIGSVYKKALVKHIKGVVKAIESHFSEKMEGFAELSKQYELLDKHICKVNRFIDTYVADNWIMNIVKPDEKKKRAGKKYEFKPIDVSTHANDLLYRFGGRILMMSATIIDKDVFCRSIGIENGAASYIRMPSPFAVENKPIHFIPTGSMSLKCISNTLPIMARAVEMLLEQHANEKGVIHANSYKVVQYLIDHVKSSRLLFHSTFDREAVLKQHLASSEPTVLVSPSMTEGVDLADDASRFQILCKVPYPYLGDQVVKKRMAKDDKWYDYQTAKTVIQALGRSVRNETDHAVSYILDADWRRFFAKNKQMFPDEFCAALQ